MRYQPGDYVYPTDLPRRLLCRVSQAESLNPPGEGFQILKLTPLEGPWSAETQLVRFADGVRLAQGWPHARILEQRVRRLVADHLGVDAEELTAEASLTEDLAADSLDLVELALGLEEELEITVPARVLDRVRTYRELVGAVWLLARAAHRTPALVSARIEAPADRRVDTIERMGPLTPHSVEITHGARDSVARVRERLGWLGRRGGEVTVRRDARAAGRARGLAAGRRDDVRSASGG